MCEKLRHDTRRKFEFLRIDYSNSYCQGHSKHHSNLQSALRVHSYDHNVFVVQLKLLVTRD